MQYGHHFFPRHISLKYQAELAKSIPAFTAAMSGTNGFVRARSAPPKAAIGNVCGEAGDRHRAIGHSKLVGDQRGIGGVGMEALDGRIGKMVDDARLEQRHRNH
jgi:hypothetical protein